MHDPHHDDDSAPRALTRLTTGYALRVTDDDRTLEVYAPDGRMCVQLVLAPEGPRIELRGASLAIRTDHELTIDCERLDVRAAHGIALVSGGDLELAAVGELRSEALAQRHVARRGDVQFQAESDVQLDGGRVLINSPKPGTVR